MLHDQLRTCLFTASSQAWMGKSFPSRNSRCQLRCWTLAENMHSLLENREVSQENCCVMISPWAYVISGRDRALHSLSSLCCTVWKSFAPTSCNSRSHTAKRMLLISALHRLVIIWHQSSRLRFILGGRVMLVSVISTGSCCLQAILSPVVQSRNLHLGSIALPEKLNWRRV